MRFLISLPALILFALPTFAQEYVAKAPPVTVDDRLLKIEQRLDAIEKKLAKAEPVAKAVCVCGDSCQCPAGVCPACPAANRLVIAGVPHVQGVDGVYRAAPGYASLSLSAPVHFGPAFGGCSNGQCGGSRFRR
jgi:hypothetical protein